MKKEEKNRGEIIIYRTPNGPELEVRLREETIWLTQAQVASLFDTERSVITKHLRNIFQEGEVAEKSNVQNMHIPKSDKPVKLYNLDVIISVGYRVNSKRATQFRIWATKTIKKFLVQGYMVNEKRLLSERKKLKELQNTIAFLSDKSKHQLMSGQEQEILSLLSSYSKSLTLLDQYDKNQIKTVKNGKAKYILSSFEVRKLIVDLKTELGKKNEAGSLFGQEYTGKYEGIIKGLYQTFDGKELYGSIEEKAAHLLYLTIKDHPFTDGNKRIASFLFVYYLDRNNFLYKQSGEKKINDSALVALSLLIAISDPNDKEIMIKIITNLL
jgi:prophage maintenance system killer protein